MKPYLLSLPVALLFASCSSPDPTPASTGNPPRPPPPTPAVNEQTTHSSVHTDQSFQAEVVTQFRTTDKLPDLDVATLAIAEGNTYAGTPTGLFACPSTGNAFAPISLQGSGPILDLATLQSSKLLIARKDSIEVLDILSSTSELWTATSQDIRAVAAHGSDVYIAHGQGLSLLTASMESPIAAASGIAARDVVISGDVVWIATASGISRYDIPSDQMLPVIQGVTMLPDPDVRALTRTQDGQELLAATAKGLARIQADGSKATLVLPGADALPNADLKAVSEAAGEILTGHAIGATAMKIGHRDHYHSLRWLPDEAVTAVVLAPDGTRWIGTHQGISRIAHTPMTLADKAAAFELQNEKHWRMDGFVSDSVNYADPYDLNATPSASDHDNDGLWTEMQVAAWCFAYAHTKDESYYQRARKAMDTMLMLFDVPAETFAEAGKARGFITRSLVRDDEGALFMDKASQSNWHKQDFKGHTYYWKDDTSSDEYVGHFFGIPIFYDLCAKTDEERQAIRDRIDSAMSYIVNNGYLLPDLDGEPTTHGHWKDLAVAADGDIGACLATGNPGCFESYGGGGWLNSMEIMGHLLAAWHITGKDEYYYEYDRLAIDERYGDMVPIKEHTFTVTNRGIANHSDHELASLSYYTLLRYEPNADRRAKWIESLLAFYGYEALERNALEHALIVSAVEKHDDLPMAVQTLMEWPMDQREWLYDNSHRLDVLVDEDNDRFDKPQFTTVLPYDEIRTMKWNGNPYAVVGGGNGKSVQAPWPYLLPYWMMRYYGTIQ